MDRKHHFSSSLGPAAKWIGVKKMVVVVPVGVTHSKSVREMRRAEEGVQAGETNWKNKRGTGALL